MLDELKAKLHHRRLDVRAEALAEISAIAGARETPLYLDLLFDPHFRQKLEVLRAIAASADGRAVDGVLDYLHANAQKLRARRRNALRRQSADESLACIASYLSRFAVQRPDVRPAIRDIAALSPYAAHAILPKIA